MDLKRVTEKLDYYIRPHCFPLAVKMCHTATELPEKARMPGRDLGYPIALCQAIGMGRRYGWTMALGRDDISCAWPALSLGFLPARPDYLDGSFSESIRPGSKEQAARDAREMWRLEYGKYSHIVLAPVHNATFEPQLIVLYGDAAQIARLVQGALWTRGGFMTTRAGMGMDCVETITGTLVTDECRFVLPSGGNRIIGSTQDHELAFAMPASKAETVIEGLEASHKAGVLRYPVPTNLRFQPQHPPDNVALMEFLKRQG